MGSSLSALMAEKKVVVWRDIQCRDARSFWESLSFVADFGLRIQLQHVNIEAPLAKTPKNAGVTVNLGCSLRSRMSLSTRIAARMKSFLDY